VIVADIDPAKVREARTRIPSLQHDRPFQIGRAQVLGKAPSKTELSKEAS
jgi:predicted amidohydrolase